VTLGREGITSLAAACASSSSVSLAAHRDDFWRKGLLPAAAAGIMAASANPGDCPSAEASASAPGVDAVMSLLWWAGAGLVGSAAAGAMPAWLLA